MSTLHRLTQRAAAPLRRPASSLSAKAASPLPSHVKSEAPLTKPKTVSLMSMPVNLGQPFLGPDQSPNLLKQSGLASLLGDWGWEVNTVPDLVMDAAPDSATVAADAALNARNCTQVGRVCKKIYDMTAAEAADKEKFLLILGGDHCIPIGTIPAIYAKRPNTGIVWVDAHADINTPKSSLSGNMHGMPLAFLLGQVENLEAYPSLQWFRPCVDPRDIVYIGLRDLDSAEKATIRRLGIKSFTMFDIDRLGIGRVMEEVDEHLRGRDIHLSYDIDAIDPFFAPHTGTAVRGGLTFREANYICEALSATGRLRSMELVEVNPSLHTNIPLKSTVEMALTLIGSSMGSTIL